MKSFAITLALLGSCAAAGSAQATQFVVNGDFSQLSNGLGQLNYSGFTVATGWSTIANYGYNFVMNDGGTGARGQYGRLSLWDAANVHAGDTNSWNGQSPTGGNFAALDGDYDVAPLSQTITGLTVGQTYTLTFDYAFGQQQGYNGPTVQSLSGTLGDTSFSTADFDVASHGFTGWQTFTETITANSTSEVLSFVAHGNLPIPPFALLTDVSLTSAVPEPATWAMMIVGLGALGVVARRRQALATA